jgi:heme exporter protein B
MKQYFNILRWLIWKDIKCEFRRREMLSSMLIFALVVLVIFHFTFSLETTEQDFFVAGLIWVAFSFAGTLGLNRSAALDMEGGRMDGLLMCPVDRSVFFIAKNLSNWLVLLLMALFLLPAIWLLYGFPIFYPEIIVVVLLGTLGFTIIGNLLSAMASQTRMRDTMLSILLFPVLLPLVLAAVNASTGIFQQLDWQRVFPWIQFLCVYDVIFFSIGLMVYPLILEE